MSGIVFVTLVCCRLLRYVLLTMVVFNVYLDYCIVYGVCVCVNVYGV